MFGRFCQRIRLASASEFGYTIGRMERLFSTVQVAELLGVTTGVVSAWMRKGMLKVQQLPQGLVRVSERNLVNFLRDQRIDLGVMMKDIASAEDAERQATSDKNGRRLLSPMFPPVAKYNLTRVHTKIPY